MRKLWVISAKEGRDVVYLKVTEKESTAERYLEECRQFFNDCEMKMGEFYTLDEAERLNL
jgi:hypothetical protein